MKSFLFIVLTFFCTAGLAGSNPEKEPFIVGTASGYAPFVSLNEQGKYEGFDIDLAEALSQKLNRKLVLKDLGSMPSLLLALKQGKVDALIWAISITEERQKTFEMVYYQGDLVESMPLIFWKTVPKEMSDLTICVEAGSYQEDVLKKLPGIKLKYLDSITAAVMDIKMGKSSAAAIDPSLLSRFKTRYPEIQVLNLPLPPSQQSLGNGICLNKANPALAALVREAIGEMTQDGTIAELEKKWKLR